MKRGRSKKWLDWRQNIVWQCDALTREMSPPIPLREISLRCRVKEVVFQPLLVEAGLAVDDDGFVVFVSCDEEVKQEWTSAFNNETQKDLALPRRVRFSLAHELIHTFFYDTKQQPYRNRLSETHYKEIDSLEAACNYGASQLLLPTRQLKSDTNKIDVLSTSSIVDLAKKYRVSIECLIHRMTNLEDWTPQRGLLAYVQEVGDVCRIKAIAISASVRGLFEKKIKDDGDFEAIFGKSQYEEMKRNGNGSLEYELTYPRGVEIGIVKCRLEYRRVTTAPDAFVLAQSIADQPRAPTKREHPVNKDFLIKLRQAIKKPGMGSTHLESQESPGSLENDSH